MHTKKTLALLFDAMNKRSFDSLRNVLADDVVFHFPKTEPIMGQKKVITFIKILFRKFPELTFTVGRTTCGESTAAAEWTNLGKFKNGLSYSNAGVTFIETNGKEIVYLSDTFKDTSLF